jgi:PucR family transcriptional regulator, purine catabolism regulatory protein
MFRLLSILAREPSANEMAHTIIGTLAAYNRERGLDLLHTLSSYIHHQGNVTQTSRALSLHRQSLLYRLRKIESLTGRSLENPDDLFLLQLCLKLWTMRFEINTEETTLVQSHSIKP